MLCRDYADIFYLIVEPTLFRLRLLEKKLDQNPRNAELYYSEMDRLFYRGYAILAGKLPEGRVWYLPHFGIDNFNKRNKVCFVFDAAAKSNFVSFNDLLVKGPDLLKPLFGVLARFRQNFVAVKRDMRDMFLKIKIIKEDQDAQRSL